MDDLKETMENVSRLSNDRLSALEQALPLAEHLVDAHTDLCHWLDDIEQETNMMDAPSLRAEQIMRQQEINSVSHSPSLIMTFNTIHFVSFSHH
jgi:hypothetical protein